MTISIGPKQIRPRAAVHILVNVPHEANVRVEHHLRIGTVGVARDVIRLGRVGGFDFSH